MITDDASAATLNARAAINLSNKKFKVGDYLIHGRFIWNDTYEYVPEWEKIGASGINRKFKVIDVDEWGLPTVQGITFNGKLQAPIIVSELCMSDYIWELDPDLAEHVLLGLPIESFNPLASLNKRIK
jgi:hypothetical protein